MTAKSTESEEVVEGEYNTVSTGRPSLISSPYGLTCHFHAALASEQLFLGVQAKKRLIIIVIIRGKMVFYGFGFSFTTIDHMT